METQSKWSYVRKGSVIGLIVVGILFLYPLFSYLTCVEEGCFGAGMVVAFFISFGFPLSLIIGGIAGWIYGSNKIKGRSHSLLRVVLCILVCLFLVYAFFEIKSYLYEVGIL